MPPLYQCVLLSPCIIWVLVYIRTIIISCRKYCPNNWKRKNKKFCRRQLHYHLVMKFQKRHGNFFTTFIGCKEFYETCLRLSDCIFRLIKVNSEQNLDYFCSTHSFNYPKISFTFYHRWPCIQCWRATTLYLCICICVGIPRNIAAHAYGYNINMVYRRILWSGAIQKSFLTRRGLHSCEVCH